MARLLSMLVLAGLQVGSISLYADAGQDCGGCPCPCGTDQAVVRVWRQKDGPPDRFAARAISSRFDKMAADNKTELLVVLGRSARGVWGVEATDSNGTGSFYINLVCTTIDGKRQVFPLIKHSDEAHNVQRSSLASLTLRRLRQLARSGQWDVGSLAPVQLPPRLKPPSLVYREKGKAAYEKASAAAMDRLQNAMTEENMRAYNALGYVWTLNVRGRDGRLMRVERGSHCDNGNFAGAKCFGGIADDANGETWWILVKHTASHTCWATWHSIRLQRGTAAKQ